MAKKYIAGISYSSSLAQTAVLEFNGQTFEVISLDERKKTSNGALWFLESFVSSEKKILNNVEDVSIGIDGSTVFLHEFPMDSSLSQVDQNAQVNWELSHYIADYKKDEYINEIRLLRSNAREQVMDVLVVSLNRSFIFSAYSFLTDRNINLHSVDVNQFAAHYSLLHCHPEVKLRMSALVGIWDQRADISILRNGKIFRYGFVTNPSVETVLEKIFSIAQDLPLLFIFLHGDAITPAWTKGLREKFGSIVSTLNPFKKVQDRSSQKKLAQFIGTEHRFAAAIGSALRNL
jgi:Tfp pilus assembly PilM family ATPase